MSLSNLAAFGSFVSGLAVLVSLVLLYFQLRQVNAQVLQTETNQRALMNQGAITRSTDIAMWGVDPAVSALAAKIASGEQEFSLQEVIRTSQMLRVTVVSAQDAFIQHRAGLVDQITLDNAMGALRAVLRFPVHRANWKRIRLSLAPDWVSYIDKLIEEMPIGQLPDRLSQFNADLAEVMRKANQTT